MAALAEKILGRRDQIEEFETNLSDTATPQRSEELINIEEEPSRKKARRLSPETKDELFELLLEEKRSQNALLGTLDDVITRFEASAILLSEEIKSNTASMRQSTALLEQALRQQMDQQNFFNQQMVQMFHHLNFTLARLNNHVPIPPQYTPLQNTKENKKP